MSRSIDNHTPPPSPSPTPLPPPLHPTVAALEGIFPSTGNDSRAMLVLVHFVADSLGSFPREIFNQLSAVHRTWRDDGGICPSKFGIAKELIPVLPKGDKEVKASLENLIQARAISEVPGKPNLLRLEVVVFGAILPHLGDPDSGDANWMRQMLLVLCRLVPFKFLDPEPSIEIQAYVAPLLERCLDELRNKYSFVILSHDERRHVALCLVEITRWRSGSLKRRATTLARELVDGIETVYLESSIVCQEVAMLRDAGHDEECRQEIICLIRDAAPFLERSRLEHASLGLAHAEKSLIHFKNGFPLMADRELKNWAPLPWPMSEAEARVVFRMDLLRGMYLRHLGKWEESMDSLLFCREFIQHPDTHSVVWKVERTLVAYHLGAVLRELDRPVEAERLLVAELSRNMTNRSRALLTIILAEVLFAQTRWDESYHLCREAEKLQEGDPRRLGWLNSCVIKAKIHHMKSEAREASFWWKASKKAMKGHPMWLGSTHLILRLSFKEALRQQEVEIDDEPTVPAEHLSSWLLNAASEYWLPGIEQWKDYLDMMRAVRTYPTVPASPTVSWNTL